MNVKGKTIELLSSKLHGNSHVIVEVQRVKYNENGFPVAIGPILDGVGGFQKVKDFDYHIAEQAALEVAVGKAV